MPARESAGFLLSGYFFSKKQGKDDSFCELWLEPDSLALEGFMYRNAKDTLVIRSGFFPAFKEDRLEEWRNDLINDPNTVG